MPKSAKIALLKANPSIVKPHHSFLIIVGGLIAAIVFVLTFLMFNPLDRIALGVDAGGVDLSFLTKEQAASKLASANNQFFNSSQKISSQNQTIDVSWQDLGLSLDVNKTVENAYNLGRSGPVFERILSVVLAIPTRNNVSVTASKDEVQQKLYLSAIANTINNPGSNATIVIENNEPKIVAEKYGDVVDTANAQSAINQNFSQKRSVPVYLVMKKDTPQVTASGAQKALEQTKKLVGYNLALKFKENTWTITPTSLFGMLAYSANGSELQVTLDNDKLDAFVSKIAREVNQDPKNAQLNIENGTATLFTPAQDGQKLDMDKTLSLINQQLNDPKLEGKTIAIDLPVEVAHPEITNDKVNELGIKELVARGWSSFAGSIAGRVYNVKLAASRINGTIIKPGETYSFNNDIGDVSEETGYQTAYIIEKGRTVFGAGGGVCQVSTTTFRAALNAGLPIAERHAHAYRVSYYEQSGFSAGLDATIYYPNIDLKFLNDTPNHLLIHAYVIGSNLYVDLYGTKDNRQVTVGRPVITNQVAPPETLYQDDPTLPKGTTKQADFSAWGANAFVSRTITKDGQTKTDSFNSIYKPWQAIFLVGTGG